MSSGFQAVLFSWSFPSWITAFNLFSALVYLRGWMALHRVMPQRFTGGRLAAFVTGITILEVALASPVDTFDSFLLTDHMMQHMLLMMIVPPLVLLGDPVVPLLHGLPRWLRKVLGRILQWDLMRALAHSLTYAPVSLLLMSVVMIGWHLPPPYELALRSPSWHEVEHASFLIVSLIFWWAVVRPWPSRARGNLWIVPIYLLLADFVNTGLSAFLTFSDRVFYPWYLSIPRLDGISARSDQAAAGVSMWVIGSVVFLVPAVGITVSLLSPARPPVIRQVRPAAESLLLRAWLLVLICILPAAALAFGLVAPHKIDIDGDIVRAQGMSGPFEITVFSPPDPISKDSVEVAVLTQERDSGETVLDAVTEIEFRLASDRNQYAIMAHATHSLSTNRLLAAASLELPKSGTWNLRVLVDHQKGSGWIESKLAIGTTPPRN